MENLEIRELKLKVKELEHKLKTSKQLSDGLISKKIMALEVYNVKRHYFSILIGCMFWILITAALDDIFVVVIGSIGVGLLAVKIALEYKHMEYLRTQYDLKVKSIKQQFHEVSKNLENMEKPPAPAKPRFTEIKK